MWDSGHPSLRAHAVTLGLLAVMLCGPPAASANPEDGQEFRSWAARCETPEEGADPRCYIAQDLALKTEEGNRRLLHIRVGYLSNEGTPAAIVIVPLGVALPAGLGMRVDEAELVRFPFQRCTPNGCVGGLVLDESLLASLKAGRQAQIFFRDGTGREIGVPVSLLGFTAGFDSLDPPA